MTAEDVITDEERCTAVVFAAGADRQCQRVAGHLGSHVANSTSLAVGWSGDTRRLGEEADRAAGTAYCCESCKRKGRP